MLGNIRVIILPDGKFWFAQGLEIDYGAQGDSIEDAKENFQQGFSATINLNLQNGTIEKIRRFAPPEILQEILGEASRHRLELFAQVSFPDIGIRSDALLFNGLDYYRQVAEGI